MTQDIADDAHIVRCALKFLRWETERQLEWAAEAECEDGMTRAHRVQFALINAAMARRVVQPIPEFS